MRHSALHMFSANNSGRGAEEGGAQCRRIVSQHSEMPDPRTAMNPFQPVAADTSASAVFVHSFDQCNINRLHQSAGQ